MKKMIAKVDVFDEMINKYAVYEDAGYYLSSLIMPPIISEELKMSFNEAMEYAKNVEVKLTEEEIKKYLEERFVKDDPELKKRLECKEIVSKNLLEVSKEEIEFASQRFVDNLVASKYKFDSYTLEYFKTYIEVLKKKSLALFEFVNNLQDISLGKIKDEEQIKQIINSLSKYDITILENGDIGYLDLIRLVTPLIENVLDLKEMVELANRLETYLEIRVHKDLLYRDGFSEYDLYPESALQVKKDFYTRGYIRLSYGQKKEIENEESQNFLKWLDIVIDGLSELDSNEKTRIIKK